MSEALHAPYLIPVVQPASNTLETEVQNAKRIEKMASHSSSHRTAGTANIQDQHHQQATVTRAYQIWEENGRQQGHSERDWYQAVKDTKNIPGCITDAQTEISIHVDGVSMYPTQEDRNDILKRSN